MRQLVVDTETTGLEFSQGHRVIEIGCVEMLNRRLSGSTFHRYINPQREIDEAAFEVHGITIEQLKDCPTFAELADELLEFIHGAELIIHNAPFDMGFLNNEFELAGREKNLLDKHCTVLDTLAMARKKFPGRLNSLDALCKRYKVDNTQRTLHGALLDAEILADVYLVMTGGQVTLLNNSPGLTQQPAKQVMLAPGERVLTPLIKATTEELEQNQQWLQLLEKQSVSGAIPKQTETAND